MAMNKPQGRQSWWVRAGCRSLTVIWGTPPVRRVFQSLGPGDLNARLTSWMYTRTGIVEGAPPAMCRQRSSEHGHLTRSGHQPHPHLPRPRRPQRHHQSRGKTPYTSQQITTRPTHVNRLCRPLQPNRGCGGNCDLAACGHGCQRRSTGMMWMRSSWV